MTKEEVYKLIEYHGLYDDKVKHNLKKLLKKYHPDKKPNDNKIIKVIYEVKKELETNHVSYNPNKKILEKKEKLSDKEKKQYQNELIKLDKDKEKILSKIKEKHKDLSLELEKYNKIYYEYCENNASLCEIKDIVKTYYKINLKELIIYALFLIVSILNTIKYHFLLLFSSLILFMIIIYINYQRIKKVSKKNVLVSYYQKKDKSYSKNISDISGVINDMNQNIIGLERELSKIENDIRFYKNRLK